MEEINVPTIDGMTIEEVYNIEDFDFGDKLKVQTVKKQGRRTKHTVEYINTIATFDIETTTLDGIKDSDGKYKSNPYGFMYHWQFCLFNKVVFGRTWEEFIIWLDRLADYFNTDLQRRLIIYVHNLSFEFQFIKEFIEIERIFAKDKRKPITVLTKNGLEFRCSYFLSNMSLQKFCENSVLCKHYKLSGEEYDYNKVRTPSTPLTEEEKGYCYNDVRGLSECIQSMLLEDTLATIPLTNTGYVRREYREAVNKNRNNRKVFEETRLNVDEYTLARKAFRGGNTHANRFKANKILDDVHSFDIQSSYPACIMLDDYPIGKFNKIEIEDTQTLKEYMKKYCMLLTVTFKDIVIKKDTYIPYIDIAHCEKQCGIVNDNGRVLQADFITINLTNIDLEIIFDTYNFDAYRIDVAYYATKGKLNKELRTKMLDFYNAKTQLKGIEGKEYEYMKSKNRLNSTFGCMVTDILHSEIEYNSQTMEWNEIKVTEEAKEEELDKFYKSEKNFLSYQHGVFVTANARRRIQRMINVVGSDIVYIDTDSIKYIGDHDKEFLNLNKQLELDCISNDIPASAESRGKLYYLGIWDFDGNYKKFKTLGAKKYAYVLADNSFHITVSGMNKSKGAKAVNNIDNFKIGKTYKNIGRTTSWYNDEKPHTITVNGETFTTASNIGILETTYTLGVTNEYYELIQNN